MISSVDSRDLETYARLRAFGYEVLLISPDPVDYVDQRFPLNEINVLAIRSARIERAIQMKRLLKMGIEVIDWKVTKPLDAIIHASAKHMNRKRNF